MELSKDKWRLEIERLRNSLKKLRNILHYTQSFLLIHPISLNLESM